MSYNHPVMMWAWWGWAASVGTTVHSDATVIADMASMRIGTFPNAVEITTGAFKDMVSLEEVVVGPGLRLIGDFAFSGCTSLRRFTVGAAVERIGIYAFSRCMALAVLDTSGADALHTVGRGAFYQCSALRTVSLPPGCTVGPLAFYGLACCPSSECNSCPLPEAASAPTSMAPLAALAVLPVLFAVYYWRTRQSTFLVVEADDFDGYVDLEAEEDPTYATVPALYELAGQTFADHAYEEPISGDPRQDARDDADTD
jgi:hypothetical protein